MCQKRNQFWAQNLHLPSFITDIPSPTIGKINTLPSTTYGPVKVSCGIVAYNSNMDDLGSASNPLKHTIYIDWQLRKWNYLYLTSFTLTPLIPVSNILLNLSSMLTGLLGFLDSCSLLTLSGSVGTKYSLLCPFDWLCKISVITLAKHLTSPALHWGKSWAK